MRAPRREGVVREGARGGDHRLHRSGRSLRGAGGGRARARHGAARPRGERAARARKAGGARADRRRSTGMSAVTEATERLIKPHGGKLVDRTGTRSAGVDSLEQVALTSRELSDLDMLA